MEGLDTIVAAPLSKRRTLGPFPSTNNVVGKKRGHLLGNATPLPPRPFLPQVGQFRLRRGRWDG